MLNRTFLYIMLFIVFILLLSMVEPSVMHGLLGAVILTLFKYLDTFVHELGHYLAGKLMGYPIKLVVIGDRNSCGVQISSAHPLYSATDLAG